MNHSIRMIIPAAGLSSRHRPNKLLMDLEGTPAIVKTVETFLPFPLEIAVIVGFEQTRISDVLQTSVGDKIQIIENPTYESGLASSLKVGIEDADKIDYFGFCLGDKPFLSRSTVSHLLDVLAFRQPLILVPTFENLPGHPVFFSATLRREFHEISGDSGGRTIVSQHNSKTLFEPVNDEGVVLDLDRCLDGKHV